jgi:hypothetical protein
VSRTISKAEGFEVAYKAFQNINFNAYDYYSIKQSIIEYIKLYHGETFNDFIESSEYVALIEVFAYLGELLAYRYDMNAHEISIQFATRKKSILRLAKLVSYKTTRTVAARGLVHIDSISTTERIFDSVGVDLSNKRIVWNDTVNTVWKDQFHTVISHIMEQKFGTVAPNERKQVNDVLYELYPLKINSPTLGVVKYSASASNNTYPMELVSSVLTEFGPQEARPSNNAKFNIVYGTDGLGDGSPNTGFFIYTKQGSLSKQTVTFDGVLPNQTRDIAVDNINNTDVWVNQIDPNTLQTYDDGTISDTLSGNWIEVDLANAQNIIFNTNTNRNKYEIETLENDRVRIVFGDGDFSNIPSGTFDLWYRTSAEDQIYVPKSAVLNKTASFSYIDGHGRTQTATITFSLVGALQNNAPSESIEHIRRAAPATYYTQDRMVNGKDYNTYPLRDSTILKLRTVNRTFSGDSLYETINDPSNTYQDVKIVGDDLAVYYKNSSNSIVAPGNILNAVLLTNYIEPLLNTTDFFVKSLVENGNYRRLFTNTERTAILQAMDSIVYPWPIALHFNGSGTSEDQFGLWTASPNANNTTDWSMLVSRSDDKTTFTITYVGQHMVVESPTTNFYYDNNDRSIISLDTLNSNKDEVVILKANVASNPNKVLTANVPVRVLEVERYETGLEYAGLPNLHQLSVMTYDTDGDSIPDDVILSQVVGTSFVERLVSTSSNGTPQIIELPYYYVVGIGDTSVTAATDTRWSEYGPAIYSIVASTGIISVVGNVSDMVNVGSIINVVHSDIGVPNQSTTCNGQYRVKSMDLTTPGITKLTIESNLADANVAGDRPNIKIAFNHNVGTQGYITVEGSSVNKILIQYAGSTPTATIKVNGYVYFNRESVTEPFKIIDGNAEILTAWYSDTNKTLFTRLRGRDSLNFMWLHRMSTFDIVDPAPTNINDMFIITNGYYLELQKWLTGEISYRPAMPTSTDLRNAYNETLSNKMISDTVITHPGKIKILIGAKANPELRAKIKVIRTTNNTLTNNQLKIKIVSIVRDFFDIKFWEFGETFYYTELDTRIQNELVAEIASTVLVPVSPNNSFGDLYQVFAAEDEILQVNITIEDVEIVSAYNSINIRQI